MGLMVGVWLWGARDVDEVGGFGSDLRIWGGCGGAQVADCWALNAWIWLPV